MGALDNCRFRQIRNHHDFIISITRLDNGSTFLDIVCHRQKHQGYLSQSSSYRLLAIRNSLGYLPAYLEICSKYTIQMGDTKMNRNWILMIVVVLLIDILLSTGCTLVTNFRNYNAGLPGDTTVHKADPNVWYTVRCPNNIDVFIRETNKLSKEQICDCVNPITKKQRYC